MVSSNNIDLLFLNYYTTKNYFCYCIPSSEVDVISCHTVKMEPPFLGNILQNINFLGIRAIANIVPLNIFLKKVLQKIFPKGNHFGNTKLKQFPRITSLFNYLKPGVHYDISIASLRYYPPQNDLPCVTFVGSPNFGERSVKRDLETQLAIVTENRDLQLKMHNECRRLYDKAVSVENRREIPPWVYAMVTLFRGYF